MEKESFETVFNKFVLSFLDAWQCRTKGVNDMGFEMEYLRIENDGFKFTILHNPGFDRSWELSIQNMETKELVKLNKKEGICYRNNQIIACNMMFDQLISLLSDMVLHIFIRDVKPLQV